MKEASVRELQHHLSAVLRWVDHGEEVTITRRKRVIARLVPDRNTGGRIVWPNFRERACTLFKKIRGKSLSDTVIAGREE